MTNTRMTRTGAAAFVALAVVTSTGCEAIIGTDDRFYVAADAAELEAAAGDATASGDGAAEAARDAGAGSDAPMTPNDGSPPPVDAAPPPVDASPPPPTCPPPGAPPGTMCCALTPCIGLACQHCNDCSAAGCATGEYCCPILNGGGKYKGAVCAATSSC